MSKSKIPTGRKAAQKEAMTPMKKGAAAPVSAFKVPDGQDGFKFSFSNGLAMQGRKLLNGLTGKKAPATAPTHDTPTTPLSGEIEGEDSPEPPRGSQTEPRPLKKKKRFSDIHRQQFAKMDSITTHYAANRITPNQAKVSAPPSDITPKNTVQTPEMAPKGIKRSKSQAVLSEREIPVSPSPVKAQQPRMVDDGEREENPSPLKRQKLDPSTAAILKKKPSKIARFAPSVTSTPMKTRHTAIPSTVAGGAIGRGLFLKAPGSTRRMSAFPKPVSNFSLTPATTLSATPSKIPTTPGRAPGFRTRVPGTAGGSKLNTMINFAEAVTPSSSASVLPDAASDEYLPTINVATPAKGTPTTVGGFTFRSRGSGLGFGALSEIHQKKMDIPRFAGQMGTPKVSENDPVGVEDPFAHVMEGVTWEEKSDDMMWAVGTPATKKVKNNKRKEVDSGDETEEEVQVSMEREDEVMTSSPLRKKLRFDTVSGREEEKEESMDDAKEEQVEKKPPTIGEAVARASRKRRINYLATPKKRVSGDGDRLGRGKNMWK